MSSPFSFFRPLKFLLWSAVATARVDNTNTSENAFLILGALLDCTAALERCVVRCRVTKDGGRLKKSRELGHSASRGLG